MWFAFKQRYTHIIYAVFLHYKICLTHDLNQNKPGHRVIITKYMKQLFFEPYIL